MSGPERSQGPRVLVVQRDASERRRTLRALHEAGMDVEGQEDVEGARGLAAGLRFEVAVVHATTTADALAAPAPLQATRAELVVILLCGPDATPTADAAARAGALLLLPTTSSTEALVRAVRVAAEHARLSARCAALDTQGEVRERLTDVLGAGAAIQSLARELERIAALRTPVTLVGEPGTGHETVARALHRRSPRAGAPFVRIGGRALADADRLSELVGGVEPGNRGQGLLERADGGTLLVEELEALSDAAQRALLQLLERGTVAPVGSSETRETDVRVVVVAGGSRENPFDLSRIRADLGLRLRTLVVELPPLRKRKDDIPLLAYRFTRAHAASLGKSVRSIGTEAMRRLREHDWPENVRELDSVLERAVARCRSDALVPGDLMLGPEPEEVSLLHLPQRLLELPYAEAKARALARLDASYVRTLLAKTGGNFTRAAALAAMDRANFRRLAKRAREPGEAD